MRTLPLFLLLLISFGQVNANTYYFSSQAGNDSRSVEEAQHPETPWKTITKLNSIMNTLFPGDVILFKRGESFDGPLLLTRSGSTNLPIVFAAYGTGEKPVINGLTTLYSWVGTGNGIWESNCYSDTMVNMVLIDGAFKPVGRYPNVSEPNKGYLTIDGTNGNTQITDNELPASPDWTGGDVVIRKTRWVIDRNLITRHSGNTINYISESHYQPWPKFGYFIQNHPKTLDIPGEWYYHLDRYKLGIYSPSGDPSSSFVQASTITNLVSLNYQSNITFDNLHFQGANINALLMNNAQHIRITNCEILYSGVNGIRARYANDITIENSVFNYTNNVACNLEDCSNVTISNNKIRNTGMVAGMGRGDSGSYEAIVINGDNETIERNEIENTGYIAITFRGNVNTIRNNYINNYALVKDDASGIYTWNNIPNSPLTYGSKIIGNVIINGIGAAAGTEWPDYYPASGIYIDDNTANLEISGNTVANCALFGMYIHNAHELTVKNNTLFNSSGQLAMTQDEHATYSAIRNVSLLNNILFAANSYQKVLELRSPNNDVAQFGTFDFNYYARPTYDILTVYAKYSVNGNYIEKDYNLDEWKSLFGKDQNSRKSPVQLSSPDLIRFEYNATPAVKTIALDGNYVDVANVAYTGSVSLEPFTSIVLMKQGSAPVDPEPGCDGAGGIYYEQWDNIPGHDILSIPFNHPPVNRKQQPSFETFSSGDNYGTRMRGYICPPVSGAYTFMVAGDDAAELYLSTDETPENKTKIAGFISWTAPREFTKYPTQKSVKINLETGRRYYIELLHKEGGGNDHVSVAWQLPDGSLETPIPGKRLVPFSIVQGKVNQSITFSQLADKTLGDPSFVLSASASSGLSVGFRVVSGPATLSGNTLTLTGTGVVEIEAFQAGNADFNPAAAVIQRFTVRASDNPPGGCAGTGSILREQWDNIQGNEVILIPVSSTPAISTQITMLEASDFGDYYGERIRGYICPPLTGNYTFLVSGDDNIEVWLSTSDNPSNKQLIAGVPGHTAFHEWNKYPSQRSAPVSLVAGTRYYIEVLHKEGWGQDHVSVGWELPNGTTEAPIPGNRLLTYNSSLPLQACAATGSLLHEKWDNVGGNDIPNIPLGRSPSTTGLISGLETLNLGDNYGERMRGYICPPVSGEYVFRVAGDDAVQLWLSTDHNPANKKMIADILSYTDFREWNRYSSQRSAPIHLQAGTRYYIEVLHKEGGGGDHLTVAWELPNGAIQIPIPGSNLSPFNETQSALYVKSANQRTDQLAETTGRKAALTVFPNPFTSAATIMYTPGESGETRLDLYDVHGRPVRSLFKGVGRPGVAGKIILSSDGLSNGVYFIHLKSRSSVKIEKITLVK